MNWVNIRQVSVNSQQLWRMGTNWISWQQFDIWVAVKSVIELDI